MAASRTRRNTRRIALWLLLLSLIGSALYSQLPESFVRGYDRLVADLRSKRQPPRDTEFVFARVRFTSNGPGRGPGYDHRTPGWSHDYPGAEEHILQIASEVSLLNVRKESHVIVDLDSEDLFKYPFAYFSEVGEMTMSDKEVANLREFFNRGGFAVLDDFDNPSLDWFAREMQKVFPGREFLRVTEGHPLFRTFYEIDDITIDPPYEQPGRPGFHAMYDRRGRIMIIGNANNDFGDYWEWIDQPQYPLPPGTAALRFGVNYLMYGLTH